MIDSRDVAYFLAFIALFLFLALRALGARSWRGVVVSREPVPCSRRRCSRVASILAQPRWLIAGRHPVRFDLTPERSLTLSPHTRQVLARTAQDRSRSTAFTRPGAGDRRQI